MDLIDRLKNFIKSQGIGQTKFEEIVGFSRGYISNIKTTIGADKLGQIKTKYPTLNIDWLITGDGDMLKAEQAESMQVTSGRDAIGNGISGDGNSVIAGSNMQNVGNSRHYDVPASGFLKIIYPDGREETIAGDSSILELSNEIKLLKAENVHLKDNMAVKDELISSMKDVIAMLKHKQ